MTTPMWASSWEALVAEFRQALQDAGIEMVMTEIQSQLDAVYAK